MDMDENKRWWRDVVVFMGDVNCLLLFYLKSQIFQLCLEAVAVAEPIGPRKWKVNVFSERRMKEMLNESWVTEASGAEASPDMTSALSGISLTAEPTGHYSLISHVTTVQFTGAQWIVGFRSLQSLHLMCPLSLGDRRLNLWGFSP